MEQNEGVYEQIIEVNNTDQGTDFLSHQLVEEIIVQNDNNEPPVNCEISEADQQRQTENVILDQESNKDEIISSVNNINENIISNSENLKEDKIEDFILDNQSKPSYQDNNLEGGNNAILVTNSENENKTFTETLTVPAMNVNEPVSDLICNQPSEHNIPNNSQNTIDSSNDARDKDTKQSEQEIVSIFSSVKESESYTDLVQTPNVEFEKDSVSNVNDHAKQNVVVEDVSQIKSQNNCISEEVVKEVIDNIDKNVEINNETSTVVTEKVEYPALISETITETKLITNSDDVAVLTEFSSLEYHTEVGIVKQKDTVVENHNQSKINEEILDNDTVKVKENVEEDRTEFTPKVDKNVQSTELENENENEDEDEDDLELHLSTQSTENHRKVIQDIFDDWQDENGEDDNQELKEHHDSVELELQNLLNDDAHQETVLSVKSAEYSNNSNDTLKNAEQSSQSTPEKVKVAKSEKSSPIKSVLDSKSPTNKFSKSITKYSSTKDQSLGRSPKNLTQDQSELKQKLQSPRPGVKVPGSHLTSQIASAAEVTEVLKERLREKQKDLVMPKTADIVFVKKITQRLSSQLSAASTVPPLIPLQSIPTEYDSSKTKLTDDSLNELNKTTSASDNKELLAILEGDVDPDWSILKPQNVTEESSKNTSSLDSNVISSSSSKLDPVTEREMALKQLLELPNISSKKSNNTGAQRKSKKIVKPTNKSSNGEPELKRSNDSDDSKMEIISLDSTEEDSPKKDKTLKTLKENDSQNSQSSVSSVELNAEESRSGRKRKLTEKAREHELTVKRQKGNKGRVSTDIKSQDSDENSKERAEATSPISTKVVEIEEPTSTSTPKVNQTKSETKQNKSDVKHNKVELKMTKNEGKQSTKASDEKMSSIKNKMSAAKRNKLGLMKKDAPISKRKLAVKNLIRQKMANKKSAVKSKIQATPATKVSPSKSASEKSPTVPPTRAKKVVTEIDKLLQDEGVVNLLYDVEQPDMKKRLVPITKSQKKIMDVEKAERELKLRTKLVRNAVMRLRNSGSSTVKISPRSRRNASTTSSAEQSPVQPEKKSNEHTNKSPKQSVSSPVSNDFIIPAKIRNAADASRIIRRHSSSSFSSASASPRVSIDQPLEQVKSEEPVVSTKSKRKLSQDTQDKSELKKSKKKLTVKSETESKETSDKSPVKKITRSNVNATAASAAAVAGIKASPKTKKVPKNKTPLDYVSNDVKASPKSQDELSACLAEAASALLTSISSRSSNTSANRKKGSTNLKSADDEKKVDIKNLFSNKEINVRQHGHLVQLILTPSSPVSGIRNAITIQVMNELREALSILKNDVDCRVVLFTSTGTSFCEGLEISSLLKSNKEERKARAKEMAFAVKDFIETLAAFNKPIVAGVQGAAIGLGVTMLPLFDLVIASDKATFSTPYGKLGQIAEGAAVLTLSHSLGSAVTNELLLGGRVLTASEALRAGLVTRVLWPDRFQGELLPSLKAMSEQSSQSMEATKALLRHGLRQKLDASLESESYLLIEHWCSPECQEAIKAYIDEKGQ